eukprot:GILK01002598.1.p1 GENE.GILK01002598.1~~GILK01002598.1.p1  ORF type:complete len:308 (+),score=33.41 GILK01002598.1:39-962(+)
MAVPSQHDSLKPIPVPLSGKLLVGAVAGVIGTTIIFPMDLVKTRLQNQKALSGGEKPYNGILDCFRKSFKEGGFRGMYRGLGPNLVGVIPEKAIKLAMNDYFREKLQGDDAKLPLWKELLAGGGAGFCQVVATNPMEITKIRLQIPSETKKSGMQVVRELGLRGLYKGTPATLMRDVPFSMVFFTLCANFKAMLADEHGNLSVGRTLLASAGAGMIASGGITPADVIKTRLQADSKQGGSTYTGIRDCYTKIVATEGYAALFRGAIPRMCIISPLFGIAILAYDVQQKILRNQLQRVKLMEEGAVKA